jgi:mRNA interferase MazF
VISSEAYHQARSDLIFMAVTSQSRPIGTIGEVAIQDWQGAGLIKPVISTIERGLVLRRLGEEDQKALRAAIAQIVG